MTIEDITPIFPSFKKNLKRIDKLKNEVDFLKFDDIKKTNRGSLKLRVNDILFKAEEMESDNEVESSFSVPKLETFDMDEKLIDPKPIKQNPEKKDKAKVLTENINKYPNKINFESADEQIHSAADPEDNIASDKISRLMEQYSSEHKITTDRYKKKMMESISIPNNPNIQEATQNFGGLIASYQFRKKVEELGVINSLDWLKTITDQKQKINTFSIFEEQGSEELTEDFKTALEGENYNSGYVDAAKSIYSTMMSNVFKSFVDTEGDVTKPGLMVRALKDIKFGKNENVNKEILTDAITSEMEEEYGEDKVKKLSGHIKNYVDSNYRNLNLEKYKGEVSEDEQKKLLENFEKSETLRRILIVQGRKDDSISSLSLKDVHDENLPAIINEFVAELKLNPEFKKYRNHATLIAAKVFGSKFSDHYNKKSVEAFFRSNPIYIRRVVENINEFINEYNAPITSAENKLEYLSLSHNGEDLTADDVEKIKNFMGVKNERGVLIHGKQYKKLMEYAHENNLENGSPQIFALTRMKDMADGGGLAYMSDTNNNAAISLVKMLWRGRTGTTPEESEKSYASEGFSYFSNPADKNKKIYMTDFLHSAMFLDPEFRNICLRAENRNRLKSTGEFVRLMNEITPLITGSYYSGETRIDKNTGEAKSQLTVAMEDYENNAFVQRLKKATTSEEEFNKFILSIKKASSDLGEYKGNSLFAIGALNENLAKFFDSSLKHVNKREIGVEPSTPKATSKFTEKTDGTPAIHSATMEKWKKNGWKTGDKELDEDMNHIVYAVPIYDRFFNLFNELNSRRFNGDTTVEAEFATAEKSLINYLNYELHGTIYEGTKPFNYINEVGKIKDERIKCGLEEAIFILKKCDKGFYEKLKKAKATERGIVLEAPTITQPTQTILGGKQEVTAPSAPSGQSKTVIPKQNPRAAVKQRNKVKGTNIDSRPIIPDEKELVELANRKEAMLEKYKNGKIEGIDEGILEEYINNDPVFKNKVKEQLLDKYSTTGKLTDLEKTQLMKFSDDKVFKELIDDIAKKLETVKTQASTIEQQKPGKADVVKDPLKEKAENRVKEIREAINNKTVKLHERAELGRLLRKYPDLTENETAKKESSPNKKNEKESKVEPKNSKKGSGTTKKENSDILEIKDDNVNESEDRAENDKMAVTIKEKLSEGKDLTKDEESFMESSNDSTYNKMWDAAISNSTTSDKQESSAILSIADQLNSPKKTTEEVVSEIENAIKEGLILTDEQAEFVKKNKNKKIKERFLAAGDENKSKSKKVYKTKEEIAEIARKNEEKKLEESGDVEFEDDNEEDESSSEPTNEKKEKKTDIPEKEKTIEDIKAKTVTPFKKGTEKTREKEFLLNKKAQGEKLSLIEEQKLLDIDEKREGFKKAPSLIENSKTKKDYLKKKFGGYEPTMDLINGKVKHDSTSINFEDAAVEDIKRALFNIMVNSSAATDKNGINTLEREFGGFGKYVSEYLPEVTSGEVVPFKYKNRAQDGTGIVAANRADKRVYFDIYKLPKIRKNIVEENNEVYKNNSAISAKESLRDSIVKAGYEDKIQLSSQESEKYNKYKSHIDKSLKLIDKISDILPNRTIKRNKLVMIPATDSEGNPIMINQTPVLRQKLDDNKKPMFEDAVKTTTDSKTGESKEVHYKKPVMEQMLENGKPLMEGGEVKMVAEQDEKGESKYTVSEEQLNDRENMKELLNSVSKELSSGNIGEEEVAELENDLRNAFSNMTGSVFKSISGDLYKYLKESDLDVPDKVMAALYSANDFATDENYDAEKEFDEFRTWLKGNFIDGLDVKIKEYTPLVLKTLGDMKDINNSEDVKKIFEVQTEFIKEEINKYLKRENYNTEDTSYINNLIEEMKVSSTDFDLVAFQEITNKLEEDLVEVDFSRMGLGAIGDKIKYMSGRKKVLDYTLKTLENRFDAIEKKLSGKNTKGLYEKLHFDLIEDAVAKQDWKTYIDKRNVMRAYMKTHPEVKELIDEELDDINLFFINDAARQEEKSASKEEAKKKRKQTETVKKEQNIQVMKDVISKHEDIDEDVIKIMDDLVPLLSVKKAPVSKYDNILLEFNNYISKLKESISLYDSEKDEDRKGEIGQNIIDEFHDIFEKKIIYYLSSGAFSSVKGEKKIGDELIEKYYDDFLKPVFGDSVTEEAQEEEEVPDIDEELPEKYSDKEFDEDTSQFLTLENLAKEDVTTLGRLKNVLLNNIRSNNKEDAKTGLEKLMKFIKQNKDRDKEDIDINIKAFEKQVKDIIESLEKN